jgi:hypothetical protein
MRLMGILLLLGICKCLIAAEPAVKPAVIPIQAMLLADMEARHLAQGGSLYAKVTSDWNGLGCTLRQGAVLEAKVLSVVPHSKTSRASEVALQFSNAQCGKSEMEPFTLDLVALAAPQEDDSSISMDMPSKLGSSAPSQGPPSNFRSMTSGNADIWWNMQNFFRPGADLRAGTVLNIRGLKLSVGTGPQNSSVLSAADRNVALDKNTLLLLLPGSTLPPIAAAPAGGSTHLSPPGAPDAMPAPATTSDAVAGAVTANQTQPDQPAQDDAELCAPPECSVALPIAETEMSGHAIASISIKELGYVSRPDKEIAALDHDQSLTYLGPGELLVTFNPHPLIPRFGATPGSTVRVIRAALVDVKTKNVMRTVDWYLPDTRQYLWVLADHRVLVHVRNELRVYGPGLKVEAHIPLDGPLNFVRTDPAGKTIAIGVVQERHTPELHAKLEEDQAQEPEEDVQIRVLNDKFETIATSMSVSNRMPPTLLNEGEVKLVLQRDKRIHVVMHTWDDQWRSIAHLVSSCTPQISSLVPDLLFVVTCDPESGDREFRVMRPDGMLVLRGQSAQTDIGYAAIGNDDTREFAVRILKSSQAVMPGEVFHGADLESEQLGVYRAADGKRIFTVRVSNPSASNGGYALAPSGDELAVLSRDGIELYSVPQN